MAKKYLSPLNLLNLTSDPGTAAEGDFYWNSSTNKLRIYFDGAWADASGGAGSAATPTVQGIVYGLTQLVYPNGNENTALGYEALSSITNGFQNTAVGAQALKSVTTADYNSAFGYKALFTNTSGQFNTAIGHETLKDNTIGEQNVAIGHGTLIGNTTGSYNTAIGAISGLYNTTGSYNTSLGWESLRRNETGGSNVAIGDSALWSSISAQYNTAVGSAALYANTASNNTAIGSNALQANTTGTNNTALGYLAGYSGTNNLTTGSNNIIIGYNAAASAATVSNEITLGNASITSFRIPGLSITANTTSLTAPSFIKSGGTSNQFLKADGSVDSSTYLTAPQEIIPLDDLSNRFNGIDTRFIPEYQGVKVIISNPYRLLLTINGIMQYIDSPDYVWMSLLPRRGLFIDSEGYLQFSEAVPAGSDFDARLMPGSETTTRTRVYPFKALDILLGG